MGDRTTDTSQNIDPRLDAPGGAMIEALMGYAAQNPWGMEYTGPRMAAMNEQQKQVMDQTADAGNAFNMGFTSARGSLPEETTIDGVQVYDTLGQARQGVSPELQAFLSMLYGDAGPLAQFRMSGAPQAGAAQSGPAVDPMFPDRSGYQGYR